MRYRSLDRGFTLIEMLLAVAMIAMLAGVLAFTVFDGPSRRYLDEGAMRIETLLRMARADAANQGRMFQLTFTEDGLYHIAWEALPLEEPGVFTPYDAAVWARNPPTDWVRWTHVVRDESDTYRPATQVNVETNVSQETRGSQAATPWPITFFPNGSCDSALIELRSTDLTDPRRAIVEVDGINGLFTSRTLTSAEVEAFYADRAAQAQASPGEGADPLASGKPRLIPYTRQSGEAP